MKKIGRKRPAASAVGETKCDSSQNRKKGANHNEKTMDAAGQTKISSFFFKNTNFTSIKEVSAGTNSNNEATTSSINKHVNSFKKRLSLGGKKSSKVNILEKLKKTTGPIEEIDALETEPEINSVYQNENFNVNYNIPTRTNEKSIDPLEANVKPSSDSPCKLRPHVTSTPNKGRICKPILDTGSSRKKHKIISYNSNSPEDFFLQSPEPEKRQKMSISNENIDSIQVSYRNDDDKIGKDARQIEEKYTGNKYQNSTMVEFEFENSICENT